MKFTVFFLFQMFIINFSFSKFVYLNLKFDRLQFPFSFLLDYGVHLRKHHVTLAFKLTRKLKTVLRRSDAYIFFSVFSFFRFKNGR